MSSSPTVEAQSLTEAFFTYVGGQSGTSQLHRFVPLRGSVQVCTSGKRGGVSRQTCFLVLVFPAMSRGFAARTFPQLGSFQPSLAEPVIESVGESGELVKTGRAVSHE